MISKIIKLYVLVCFIAYALCGTSVGLASINNDALVTSSFQNTDIRDALQTLASVGQAKIIVDTNVSAKITAQFKNTPFKEAVESLLLQAGLDHQIVGDSLYVALPGQLPDVGFIPSADASSYNPLIIKLKYLKADQMKASLGTIIPEDRIRVEPVHNTLILMGSDEEYGKIKNILAELDVPPRQVMFEAKVVEIAKSKVSQFGVKWQWSSYPSPSGNSLVGVINVNPEKDYNVNYQATLDALVNSENAKILANPRVAALDGQTAHIMIGDRLPVETKYLANGVQQVTVNYVDVGIKLEVTPWVNEEGIITTKLRPEVSTNIATAGNNPSIRTREAETILRIKDGETIVIGGLFQNEERKNVQKIPLLGDLPIVGHLFKSTGKEKRETELVIFITPKIIDNP